MEYILVAKLNMSSDDTVDKNAPEDAKTTVQPEVRGTVPLGSMVSMRKLGVTGALRGFSSVNLWTFSKNLNPYILLYYIVNLLTLSASMKFKI